MFFRFFDTTRKNSYTIVINNYTYLIHKGYMKFCFLFFMISFIFPQQIFSSQQPAKLTIETLNAHCANGRTPKKASRSSSIASLGSNTVNITSPSARTNQASVNVSTALPFARINQASASQHNPYQQPLTTQSRLSPDQENDCWHNCCFILSTLFSSICKPCNNLSKDTKSH